LAIPVSQPEQTTLYPIITAHCPRIVQQIEHDGGHLPAFVRQEFDNYLKCVKCDGSGVARVAFVVRNKRLISVGMPEGWLTIFILTIHFCAQLTYI